MSTARAPHDHSTVTAARRVVLAATLGAAILRLFRLSTLPPPAWFDEVWFALRARELLATGQLRPFYETSFGGANAGLVVLTALVQQLGLDTIVSARYVAAMAGVISVPLAYACTYALLRADSIPQPLSQRRWIAALAAVVVAYTMFCVTIGRVGMEIGLAPATALFVVWQIAQGSRAGGGSAQRWGPWILAGLAAGLAQYNGLHARFILPLVAFVLVQEFLRADRAGRVRVALGALTLAGAAIAVSLPLIGYFARHPEWFAERAGIVSVPMVNGQPTTYPEMVADNAWTIARAFVLEGSYDPKNVVPGLPLLDPIQAVGFGVGVGWAAFHLRRSALARTLLVWLALMALPSLLTEGAPNLGRMVGIVPPLAALVSLGWAHLASSQPLPREEAPIVKSGRPARESSPQPGIAAIAPTLLILSITYQTLLLFGIWPQVRNLREQFTAVPVEVATLLIDRAASEPVFVERTPEAEDVAAFEFLLPGTSVARLDFRKCLPLPHQRPTRTTYLVLTGRDTDTIARLTALYPSGTVVRPDLDLWQETAALVEVPPSASAPPPARRPVARFGSGIALYGFDLSAETLAPGGTLFVTLYWHTTEHIMADLTAFAHLGTGLDGSPLVAQRDGTPCDGLYPTSAWQPGEVVPDSFAITLPEDASPREYPLIVGWYHFPSLERLPLLEADTPLPDNRAVIGVVHIAIP